MATVSVLRCRQTRTVWEGLQGMVGGGVSATRSGTMSVGMLAGGVACSGKLELLSGTIEWNKIASDQSQVAYIL